MAEEGSALAAAIARAQEDLHVAAQGQALCRIDGSGGPTPFFVKRAEGAHAALVDVRRELRHRDEPALTAAAERVLGRWRSDLRRWQERKAGPWIAYCEGGCAAVEALLGEVPGSRRPGT